jgi:hypothetical protein
MLTDLEGHNMTSQVELIWMKKVYSPPGGIHWLHHSSIFFVDDVLIIAIDSIEEWISLKYLLTSFCGKPRV